jgi:hypothetical protein
MGGIVEDRYLQSIQAQLNLRFGPGDAIEEMVGLQREFKIFSRKHLLSQIAGLLDIGPQERDQRLKWYRYLDNLRKFKSDRPAQNGHDRIVSALKQNLESRSPLPVFFDWHPGGKDPIVWARKPVDVPNLFFSRQKYLNISVPVRPPAAQRKMGP